MEITSNRIKVKSGKLCCLRWIREALSCFRSFFRFDFQKNLKWKRLRLIVDNLKDNFQYCPKWLKKNSIPQIQRTLQYHNVRLKQPKYLKKIVQNHKTANRNFPFVNSPTCLVCKHSNSCKL